MKLHALCASAVTLMLALSAPAKAGNVNREFIALATISYVVVQKCSDYEFVDNAARRGADKMGADFDTYAPAAMNAIFAIMDMEYNREKLIPEVTQKVRSDLGELADDLKKRGLAGFCKRYGTVMVSIDWMKRK
ncbi:hypothetical protein [Bradyrhizobium ottawaense]|uniref:Uncharacterized protein n=1 Tax=Bradyrhizobium ottawaense TaxID=931866 RepID=A0ABY0QHF4_9BRAD|nr:hypothetical protein [Bradyrhizobium ottawaense]SDK43814.1 hypothetical protein SAMN05444163_8112 [Bradyrhizobium ottawaense]